MPKRRTSTIASRSNNRSSLGSGGSGGNGGSYEVSENSEVLIENNDADRNSGPVRVRFGEPGTAEVVTADGYVHQVNYIDETCDCHNSSIGGYCNHLRYVNAAVGQRDREASNGEFNIMNATSRLAAADASAENYRNEIFQDQEDDNFFYSDHADEFEEKLRSGIDVEYEYENVLNGSNATFGIELEFSGGNADAIASELYGLGICAYDSRVPYHARGVAGKWKLERDGSVSSGQGGGELVSPILQDTPQTWRDIEIICEVAKRHGATITSNCGGHVHMGMEPLNAARQRWKRFFKFIGGYEECVYRAAGGDMGRIRSGHRHYATPFADNAVSMERRVYSLDSDERAVARMADSASEGDRYLGINLTNIVNPRKPDTVEFRYFNGSLNPKQIQANIKLANGIMRASEQCRTRPSSEFYVTENEMRRGKMLNYGARNNEKSSNKIKELLDICFTRKKDKDALLNVFSKNEWR